MSGFAVSVHVSPAKRSHAIVSRDCRAPSLASDHLADLEAEVQAHGPQTRWQHPILPYSGLPDSNPAFPRRSSGCRNKPLSLNPEIACWTALESLEGAWQKSPSAPTTSMTVACLYCSDQYIIMIDYTIRCIVLSSPALGCLLP